MGLNTAEILDTVAAIERLRAELSNSNEGGLSSVRDELLKLHRLALAVRECATQAQVGELFDLANALELQVGEWMEALGTILATLTDVTSSKACSRQQCLGDSIFDLLCFQSGMAKP